MASIRLTDGSVLNVKESLKEVLNILYEAEGPACLNFVRLVERDLIDEEIIVIIDKILTIKE